MAVTPFPDAGTRDVRVDRPNEGLPGIATVENPTANPPTRASFDTGHAAGGESARQMAIIDTTQTSGLDWAADTKRGNPNVW